jgi:hypothetical protein
MTLCMVLGFEQNFAAPLLLDPAVAGVKAAYEIMRVIQ